MQRMDTHKTPAEMTFDELRAAIRELAGHKFSTVGDERSQAASIRQWSRPMQPYMDEILRRDKAGEL